MVSGLDRDVVFGATHNFVGHDLFFAGYFIMPTTHETLDRINRTFGIGNGLTTCGVANERFSLVVKGNHTRG